jgi:hypothetical protein
MNYKPLNLECFAYYLEVFCRMITGGTFVWRFHSCRYVSILCKPIQLLFLFLIFFTYMAGL